MGMIGIWAAAVSVFASLFGSAAPIVEDGLPVISDRLAGRIAPLAGDDLVEIIVETEGPAAPWTEEATRLGLGVGGAYELIPAFSATATVDQIHRLADEPWVTGIWESRPMTTLMDVSTRDIEATKAWTAGVTGAGITVAVLDTGVDLVEPDLDEAIVACVSTIDGLVLPDCTDSDGHGTHVAGTVASRDATFRGVAPGASLAIVRVLHAAGAGTSADIIAGMDWVAQNKDRVTPPIRVATMSIGFADPECGNGRGPEAEAADALVARGVSFTIAAGNSGHKNCSVDGASAAFNVVTVGAVDDRNTPDPLDDTLAEFSSGGPTKDGRLKPELVAPGVNIRSLFLGPTIAELDGTSMATPHAAGAIALLLQSEPNLSPADVKSRLTSGTVVPTGAPSLPDNDWGHGVLNVCGALRLGDCAGGAGQRVVEPETVVGHVDAISMSFKHRGDKHVVYANVYVEDADGSRLQGVQVDVNITSPEGSVYARSATTDPNGRARVQATQATGGHGSWQACVTGLSIDYDASQNVETCERLSVS